eukprot:COSAG05_NODE_1043_length_6061_cov_10.071285_8_plen_38_part_01
MGPVPAGALKPRTKHTGNSAADKTRVGLGSQPGCDGGG